MKLRFLLTSVIFLFGSLVSRAQISEMLYQGFEAGETPAYTGAYTTTNQYHASGSQALMMTQTSTADVEIVTDVIDFSTNTSLRYISLEFDHICKVPTNPGGDAYMCRIYYKRPSQSNWTQMVSSNYNMTNGGSSNFYSLSAFSVNGYSDWLNNPLSNDLWKSERFDMNNVITNTTPAADRKLQLRFVLRRYTGTGAATGVWLIDNLKVSASPSPMVKPFIQMVKYPDGTYHPSSRGADVVITPSTTVSQGINRDSVYMYYTVGSDPTPIRVSMTQMPSDTHQFFAHIPFFGYDTLMRFYCVARDNTTNANRVTFPAAANSWLEYRCVRGVEQPGRATPEFTGTFNYSGFPFPARGNGKSEWVFDSARLAEAGYGPGQMTAMRMTFSAHTNTEARQRMQIRMKNIPTNYWVDTSLNGSYSYTTSYTQVVYDSAFTITEANAGTEQTVNFQDTFYYSGKDILMQVLLADNGSHGASPVKMIAAATNKKSIFSGTEIANPINSTDANLNVADMCINRVPALVMTQRANLPLLYDMGVSELVSPNYEVPMAVRPGSLTVKLKNFGALPVSGVRISYNIDDTIFGYYDWSGSLAANADENVTISTNIVIPAGYHTLKVWVQDTLTVSAGQQVRDHEPYNDTSFSSFIVCDGPMSGVRHIGGATPDFNTVEEFLFAVSRCGINDSLVVKLAPGYYQPFTMPDVFGTTATHYIVFEPESSGVTFYSALTAAESIVNLEQTNNIWFRNINFVRRSAMLTDMVKLGQNSDNCHFLGCTFVDSLANPLASYRINAMINTGYANGVVVDGCTFEGGKTGVDVKGQAADIHSSNNTVRNSIFRNQYDYAVNVSNQTNAVVEFNEMYDVLGNSNYVLLLNECSGNTRVLANKIYTSHGSGAIGVNNISGTSAIRALMANNMVVCNDDGTSSLMRSPVNIISATYLDVVYNSVKMTAATRNNTAAVSFGGGTLQNSRFLNNVVVSLDNGNYALNYAPGTNTTNVVGHNVYYSLGTLLNRRAGTGCVDLAAWMVAEPADSNSISVNPNFLNGSLVDLRTYNRLVKGVGTPLATVTTDMFGNARSLTAPCPGAFEFVSLAYDFEPEALVSPMDETCYMPSSVELKVRLRNSGVNAYTGSGLQLKYTVNGGSVNTVNVSSSVPAEDTVIIATGSMLQLPSAVASDSAYTIKIWTVYANDPNQTNDTSTFQVISKYRPAMPANATTQIDYATQAVLTPVNGINTWKVYDHTAAPQRPSEIYWYSDTNAAPIFVGPTLTTDTLRTDTTFYFRQRRNQAIVRITQLEYNHANTAVGLTPSMPYWISSGRKVALQLTNVGDAPANLEGDTLRVLVATASGSGGSVNVKDYVFGDVTIAPGASLVVQTATGNSTNPSMTIHTGTPMSSVTVSKSAHAAFIYKRNGVVEDVVALNSVNTTALTKPGNWNQQGIPSYVWGGAGVSVSESNAAGIVRTSFAHSNATDWRVVTAASPMFLGSNDTSWIRYTDNGCEGYAAAYNVTMIAPPAADIDLLAPVLPSSSCGMGMEQVSVTVRNYGIGSVSGLVLSYTAGSDTVTEAVPGTLAANGSMTYTFNTLVNMDFGADSLVTVKVWADSVSGDIMRYNDTNSASVLSIYTPDAPAAVPTRTVSYATSDTISLPVVAGLVPVWYDYDGNVVDTGYSSISEILYVGGNRGVSYMVSVPHEGIIGTSANTNANTSFPAPYQPATKYAKQQYIYSASSLRAAGLEPGYIDSIAFELKSIVSSSVNFITFDEYNISLGTTSDTIFSSNSDWKTTTRVYSRAPFTIDRSDCNTWVTHQLDTPFYWDGESSIVVQLTHYIQTNITSGVKSGFTAQNNTTLYKSNPTDLSPSTEEYVGSGTRGNNRPNIRFSNTSYGCQSSVTQYAVQMVNVPSVDMAVLWPNGVDTIDYNSCNNIPIHVTLRNQGAVTATGTKLYYYFDTLAVDSLTVSASIVSGGTANVLLFSRHMNPGRHTVRVIVAASGDDITSNDTIMRSFMVRFCSGSYTIAGVGGDYRSFGEAIDTLNVVGIEGPVTFNVSPGTYTEQVVLNNIPGSSATNTISFIGTGDNVLLTAVPTQNENYVFLLDSTSYVTLSRFRIESRPPSGNNGHALVLQKGGNITIDSCTVRVKGTINNANASAVVLLGDISNLNFVNNTIDSGYYSFRGYGAVHNYSNFTLTGNTFKNFYSQGINMRGVTNFVANGNRIQSGVTITGRGLTGIYLAQSAGNISIQKNVIVLSDEKNGGKRGIQFENINCVASNPGFIANNMISCSGTGTAGLTPAKPSGIWIDSSSTNINVYFNTVRVYCGPYATAMYSDASYSFYSGATVSNIRVMNNIFSNFSKGYAYYVSELNTIPISDYNAYYTVSNRPFAWKSTNNTLADLAALQAINSDDANSVFQEPYFLSETDLHMVMTNLAGLGQYNADVPDDIDGMPRKQVPGPTIGAHEMDVVTHDMAVVRIIEPVMPANVDNFSAPNNMPPNIEGDSVRVIAQFYNNGMAPETGVEWYAYIEGFEADTRTPNKTVGAFAPAESRLDTIMMPTVLGITDSSIVHVVVVLPADSSLSDNDRVSTFYLAPAFDLAATRMATDRTGCSMQNTTVRITVKNVGFKDIPAGTSFKIGFHPEITHPASITSLSTMPDTVEEITTLATPLLMNTPITIDFTTIANFYPTGDTTDIKFRLMGWVHHDLDITPTNDSTLKTNNTQSPIIDAYYSPKPPVGFDTTFAYGTWGEVRAMQVNSRPIRWYRDSTQATFYHPTNYAASCKWSNTPQYFHDSVYYLSCFSAKNCPSYFSAVHVNVAPHLPNDMAFEEVLAPIGSRVYMENDTVRVRIANYGNNSQTNVPVAYQLKRGNAVIQEVTEICPATIPSGQTYEYTFNTLLNLPTPITAQNYTLTVWTDLASDGARRNDTIRVAHTFRTLAESLYNCSKPGSPSFDVTRVSFNEIDYETPQQGRGYTNMASYTDPDYPVLHVTRGLSDSIFIQVTPLDGTAQANRVRAWVFIDFDRNGVFSPAAGEEVVSGEIFYDYETYQGYVTIPNDATPGYMRMRVAVGLYSDFPNAGYSPVSGIPADKDGHNLDFLLFVDPEAPQTDLAVTQIVNPRSYIIDDDTPREISFRVSNKGASAVAGPTFGYSFIGEVADSTGTGTVSYPGTLAAGATAVMTLPAHVFPFGVTDLRIWADNPNDSNHTNDTLEYQYNRFHIVYLPMYDSFEIENKWYAPRGYNVYSHNYWELGTPTKQRLNAAYSGDKAWVTDLHSNIATGKRGNVSYLYSPIINIYQIHADTISVRIRRSFGSGSSLRLEFLNYEGKWVNATRDSLFHWYNNQDDECFDGSTSGSSYDYYYAPTNYRGGMSGDFREKLQFRFVYTTPVGTTATAAFGEGCAIDDFRIGRARRNVDAGIVDIVEPVAPAYGQTIYPKVVVRNYGTDTLTSVKIGYIHYGTMLPKESTVSCNIAPDEVDTLLLTYPFVVSSQFPETFEITAFTMLQPHDIYNDNDSVTKSFNLSPLDNDISAHSFIYPLDQAVAGDSLQVTIRMRNFGASPISNATLSYIVNGGDRVDEEVDLEALLGRPLSSMEYFNYTFHQRFRAPLGVLNVVGIVKSPQNDYIYNDTISKRVNCVNSVLDIAAASVIVDTSAHGADVRVTLVIENRGARGANNFEVGFFVDGDSSQIWREVYNQPLPLPALATGYHTFTHTLPSRSALYSNVTAFVHASTDNDAGNDTTNVIVPRYIDIELLKLYVIENAEPNCKVIAHVRNNGNVPALTGMLKIVANINGRNIVENFPAASNVVGASEHTGLIFQTRIPKDPARSYVGSAKLSYVNDLDTTNNQSNIVSVQGYWDDVPFVDRNELVLDQNYPNPFDDKTTIPFSLPNDADVHFFIVDGMGHMVNSFDRHYSAGLHSVTIDMSAYTSGVYFYGIVVDGKRIMRKMILR